MGEINSTSKRAFINWFIRQFQLRKKECHWIINHFFENEDRLKKLHFVSEANGKCHRMMMATECSNEVFHFIFYYKDEDGKEVKTAFTEEAFNYIRNHPEEDFYIDFRFRDREIYHLFLDVLEDKKPEPKLNPDYEKVTDSLFENILFQQQIEQLKEKIDETLRDKNEEQFIFFSTVYIDLLNNKPTKLYETHKKKK